MSHKEVELPVIPALRADNSVQMMLNMHASGFANPVSGDATLTAPPEFIEPPC